jgi:prepilin-type N-terminal cleavage/methylation domain-containing protein
MFKHNLKNKKSGFSLLELVLAIAIFSLSSFALATMLIDSNISVRLSTERTEALFYAKEGVEAMRSIRNNNPWAYLTEGEHYLDESGETWALTDIPNILADKYTRVISIEDLPDDPNTKNITVTVGWDINSGRTASVNLETVLTNWQNN